MPRSETPPDAPSHSGAPCRRNRGFRWAAFVAGLWLRRRRGIPRPGRAAALALACLALGACSELATGAVVATPPATQPNYVPIVAAYLRSTFKDSTLFGDYRISQLRWVDSMKGWSWLACVHFQDRGRVRSYAVFIQTDAVVDARYAVETDRCESLTYTQFDLISGALGQPTPPAQPPLY